VSAHLTLIGDSEAYDVPLESIPVEGKPFERASSTFLVTLPKTTAIRYAYVDSYSLDNGVSKSCATEPVKIETWSPSRWHPVAPQATSPRFAAVAKGELPPIPCGKVFTEAYVTQAFRPPGLNSNARVTAQVEVIVDSEGHPIQMWVHKSSGIEYADELATGAAQRSTYAPATFLCSPIVGRYLFRVDFTP
jgi:hypothetical protein